MQIPRLREWREARALTQVELAERAGVSSRSVAGYEAGTGARPPTVRRLAKALDVEVGDLFPKKVQAPPEPEVKVSRAAAHLRVEGTLRAKGRVIRVADEDMQRIIRGAVRGELTEVEAWREVEKAEIQQ